MANILLESAKNYLNNKTKASPLVSSVTQQPNKPKTFLDNAKTFVSGLRSTGLLGIGLPDYGKAVEQTTRPVVEKISQNPIVKNVLTEVSRRTSGTGIEAMIKASSPDITFQQAYEAAKKSQFEKDDTFQEKFLTQLKDTAPQTAIGVALNFVPIIGKTLSTVYWSAISAGSQIEEKDKVTSLTDIGIDVIGDRMLGNTLESLFKKPANTLAKTVLKTFTTEGGTEVTQDLLKYANDYNNAMSQSEKDAVLASAKEYFTSGQILLTAGVGGVTGAGIGTTSYTIQQTPQVMEQRAKELSVAEGISIEEARKRVQEAGFAKLPGKKPITREEIAKRATELTKKNGGVTINLSGDIPIEGFAYSPYKDAETIIPKEQFSDADFDNFIEREYNRLSEEGNHIGAWEENGKIYIDISKVNPNEQEAVQDAINNNQIGLFDLSTFETKYTKNYEKVNNAYTYKGEKQGTTQAGGEKDIGPEKIPPSETQKGLEEKPTLLPAVIQGDTFTLGVQSPITTKAEAKAQLKGELKSLKQQQVQAEKNRLYVEKIKARVKKLAEHAEIRATQKEISNAKKAQEKAARLEARQQKIRQDNIKNINLRHGKTADIIQYLKEHHLSDEDIENIILENGVKLVDTVAIKRNEDHSLAAVITKEDIQRIKENYKGEKSPKWKEAKTATEILEGVDEITRLYELPTVWFKGKGLGYIWENNNETQRATEVQKTLFLNKFKKAGLFKKGGFFTADGFTIDLKESKNIAKYYLTRQNKLNADFGLTFEELSDKEKKFVSIFDSIIDETENRFYETAKMVGKNPGVVENYAPLMTKEDIKLADQTSATDWLFRKHPAFFSLKERIEEVPTSMYEMDYRKVVARWLDGMTKFINTSENLQNTKFLIENEEFQNIVNKKDQGIISKWLQDITTPRPVTTPVKVMGVLRRFAASAALGLNYASVVKQALTQIPLTIIEKAPPKLKSTYAQAFGINVADMPSITKRSGDIAITDLQGKVGRIFTGAITEFDRKNAQLSLNALLDKEYNKFLKEGIPISDEARAFIEKKAQDTLDLWYGSFFNGAKPEAFRGQLGNFLNMFIYPLTSQLNGFVQHVTEAKGFKATSIATAEVVASAIAIAYLEQVITKLSFKWDDEEDMTKDVLNSLISNLPLISQLVYTIQTDQQLQISAGLSGISNLIMVLDKKLNDQKDWDDVLFAIGETFGIPKQFRRFYEGAEVIINGGVVDKNKKMNAPVNEAFEIIRSFLRGKYGSLAAQDYVSNIGISSNDRRWFVPEVEFLQNGDYIRKAELFIGFDKETRDELLQFFSDGQKKLLLKGIKDYNAKKKILEIIRQKLIDKGILDEKTLDNKSEEIYSKLKLTEEK